MLPPVATNDPTAVQGAVETLYLAMFPGTDGRFVPEVFGWATDCFTGRYRDYQAVDAHYHDFEHTLQGTLCMARLLLGRHAAGATPRLTERLAQLGLLAILLHDTGYLKKRNDTQGTGAKYTVTHVNRSAEFAAQLLQEKGFAAADIQAVQYMIRCTGLEANLSAIPFQDEPDKLTGFALATSDLLGQMAAPDYVDKLPVLYLEFAEAAAFSPGQAHFIATFSSAEDLMRKTPGFWEKIVQPKLEREFQALYRFLNAPYPLGANPYLERIEANMCRLRQQLTKASLPAI